ncbi:MAG TPA: helix-turn-helix transcriptional regulator [Patescibacteria group bacterium]|jgi:transcriptional regulator with XRE-family HTH domain|nr:helix-turn-helix transcriptional regulator [Patescibacteria group bacterium]
MDSPENKKTLGDKFRIAREEQNLTQLQVAKKAGISVNYYARVERGDPDARWSVINSIAKALGINVKLPI